MKGRVHVVATSLSVPEAHFPPWGGMGPLPRDALSSSPLYFLEVFQEGLLCVPGTSLETRKSAFRS